MTIDLSHPNTKNFHKYAIDYCYSHKKSLELRDASFLRLDGGRCTGWCDGETLVVAKKHYLSLDIYSHEFSHMTQAVDNCEVWQNTESNDYSRWLLDDPLRKWNEKLAWEGIFNSIKVERDCELRSLRNINKWDLPIDPSDYAKRANLYLFFYHYLLLRRRWRRSNDIYKKELLDLMPEKLLPLSRFKKIDMDLMAEYHSILD